jgi:hypothetical protein
MTIFGGVPLYLGLLCAAAGVLSLPIPLRFLGIRTRKRGLAVLALGFAAIVASVCLPVSETRVGAVRSRLDEFMPVYQFSEFHGVDVGASREQIWRALWEVRPEEIRFAKTLMRIRGLGDSMAPEGQPILKSFASGPFQMLAREREREVVFGRAGDGRRVRDLTAEEFKTAGGARLLKLAMNLRIEEAEAGHCLLTTETRVYAVGPQVVRGFATYWRLIYPGSALIRRMWLRAIKLRAEAR